MTVKPFLSALICIPLFAACSFNVATPPARNAFFGSPRILPAGESAITGEGAMVAKLFGPSMWGGSLTYEKGLGNLRELVVTPTAGLIQDRSGFLGLSLDIKQGTPETRHVAFTYGAGFLRNEFANAVSAEAGMLVGFENRFFVPTLSMMAFLSQPFMSKAVCNNPDDSEDEVCVPPTLTVGARVGVTAEIMLPGPASIIASGAVVPLHSQTHSFLMEQLSAALRWEI